MKYAASHQRAILTHNIRDFIILDRQYRHNGKEHCGILLSDQIIFRELLQRSLRVLGIHTAEDVNNNIFWLNEDS